MIFLTLLIFSMWFTVELNSKRFFVFLFLFLFFLFCLFVLFFLMFQRMDIVSNWLSVFFFIIQDFFQHPIENCSEDQF